MSNSGAYVAGDKVTYYRMHGDSCAAEVLSVSPRGRLRLRVHQGGVVPYYTATNVLPTSVHRRETGEDTDPPARWGITCRGCGQSNWYTANRKWRCAVCEPERAAQPGSGEVSRLAFAAGVTLGELHGNESAELQCILRKLIAAQQRIAALESDLENERARGIHTCHDQCQRPLCVAGRRIRELEHQLAARSVS